MTALAPARKLAGSIEKGGGILRILVSLRALAIYRVHRRQLRQRPCFGCETLSSSVLLLLLNFRRRATTISDKDPLQAARASRACESSLQIKSDFRLPDHLEHAVLLLYPICFFQGCAHIVSRTTELLDLTHILGVPRPIYDRKPPSIYFQ